jgi:hypothetical protein
MTTEKDRELYEILKTYRKGLHEPVPVPVPPQVKWNTVINVILAIIMGLSLFMFGFSLGRKYERENPTLDTTTIHPTRAEASDSRSSIKRRLEA